MSDDGAITKIIRQARQQHASLPFQNSTNKINTLFYFSKQRPTQKQHLEHLIPICPSIEPESKRTERQDEVYDLKSIYHIYRLFGSHSTRPPEACDHTKPHDLLSLFPPLKIPTLEARVTQRGRQGRHPYTIPPTESSNPNPVTTASIHAPCSSLPRICDSHVL